MELAGWGVLLDVVVERWLLVDGQQVCGRVAEQGVTTSEGRTMVAREVESGFDNPAADLPLDIQYGQLTEWLVCAQAWKHALCV